MLKVSAHLTKTKSNRKNNTKETQLVKDCLTFLRYKNILAFRNNSGQIFISENNKTRVIRMGIKGSPDIIGIVPPEGKFLAIECKTEKGKLTEYQKHFASEVLKRGGIYLVVRSIDDLINFFENNKMSVAAQQLTF